MKMYYGAWKSKSGKICTFSSCKETSIQNLKDGKFGKELLDLNCASIDENNIHFGEMFKKYKETFLGKKITVKENIKTYYYGTMLSKRGSEIKFSTRNANHTNKIKSEGGRILDLHEVETTKKRFNVIFNDYKMGGHYKGNYTGAKDTGSFPFSPGEIGTFLDYYGEHTAIILVPGEYKSKMLLVTSTPHLSERSRQITSDEQIMLRYPIMDRVSYFIPVTRDNDFFESIGVTITSNRTDELIEEFWPEYICNIKQTG